jgi:transposase
MRAQRYTEKFKVEAVNQVLDRTHSVAEVAQRLGLSPHCLYQWLKQRRQARAGIAIRRGT